MKNIRKSIKKSNKGSIKKSIKKSIKPKRIKKSKKESIKKVNKKIAKKVSLKAIKQKSVVKSKVKKGKSYVQSKKRQIGGNKDQQVPVGTMLKVVKERNPEQPDELKLVKDDIIYCMYSPNADWWLGISSNAVEKALKAKGNEFESVHSVTLETIEYLLKDPKRIEKNMYGLLMGWFPNKNTEFYIPKTNIVKFIKSFQFIKSFHKGKEEMKTERILKTVEMLPSPENIIAPHVQRKLENIPKRTR